MLGELDVEEPSLLELISLENNTVVLVSRRDDMLEDAIEDGSIVVILDELTDEDVFIELIKDVFVKLELEIVEVFV
jgi:hypothetical protein